MFGLAHEICGEAGLGWSRRLQLVQAGLQGAGGLAPKVAGYLGGKYGHSAELGAAALPAITRRLEELPAGARAIVLAQLDDPLDRRTFASAADVDLQWLSRSDELLAAVRALALPPGEGYAWCAGEAAAMAKLRRILVDEKGHDRRAIRAAAYWKQGAVAHHENLED